MRRVVFVAVNVPTQLILLTIYLRLLFVRQVAAVLLAIVTDFMIQSGFFVLQVSRFVRSQRTVGYPVRDTILLVFLALLDLSVLRLRDGARHHPCYSKC